jgi:hypothetical protein
MASTHSDRPTAYRKTSDGHAAVTLFDVMTGYRKEFRLGRRGTKESRRMYEKTLGEWLARGRRLTTSAAVPADLSIAEALDLWFTAEPEPRFINCVVCFMGPSWVPAFLILFTLRRIGLFVQSLRRGSKHAGMRLMAYARAVVMVMSAAACLCMS